MPIGLLNLYSTRNLGDAAIYASLAQMSPDARAIGLLEEEQPTAIEGFATSLDLKKCDTLVSVGGDIFNNARPSFVTRRFLSNIAGLKHAPKRTMVFGQSIPRSCRGLSFKVLVHTLRQLSSVTIRDEESYGRLRAAKVDAQLSYDTAFVLCPDEVANALADEHLTMLGLEPCKTALISLRNESSMYAKTNGEKQLLEVSQRLLERGHDVGLLVQADGDAADSDRQMALRIKQACPRAVIVDPFLQNVAIDPWKLFVGILSIANIVVAVRYHAAVLRLISGRSAYVLHYSNKGNDLCQRLQLEGSELGVEPPSHLIRAIENSARMDFDVAPIAQHVRESFQHALSSVRMRRTA